MDYVLGCRAANWFASCSARSAQFRTPNNHLGFEMGVFPFSIGEARDHRDFLNVGCAGHERLTPRDSVVLPSVRDALD
jgi:hypothetical protein